VACLVLDSDGHAGHGLFAGSVVVLLLADGLSAWGRRPQDSAAEPYFAPVSSVGRGGPASVDRHLGAPGEKKEQRISPRRLAP